MTINDVLCRPDGPRTDGMGMEEEGGGPTPSKAAMQGAVQKDPEVWEEDIIITTTAAEPTTSTTDITSEADKPTLSMVVIGHVDAGKSTLMGQVGGSQESWIDAYVCTRMNAYS